MAHCYEAGAIHDSDLVHDTLQQMFILLLNVDTCNNMAESEERHVFLVQISDIFERMY